MVQPAVKNKVRKQNKNMGSFDDKRGHCNRDLLCCHSRAERTIPSTVHPCKYSSLETTHSALPSVYWVEPVPGLPYSKWQRESIWPQTSWLQHLPQRNGMILSWSIQIYCWNCLLGPYALLFLSIKLCISAWTDPFFHFLLPEGTSPFFRMWTSHFLFHVLMPRAEFSFLGCYTVIT